MRFILFLGCGHPGAHDLKLLIYKIDGLPDPHVNPAATAKKIAFLFDVTRWHHVVVLTERHTDDTDRLMDGLRDTHELVGRTCIPHSCAGRRGFAMAVEAADSRVDSDFARADSDFA